MSDLADVIAWWRDILGDGPADNSVVSIRSDDLRTILDAAEAGMRAPLPATKEAVQRIKDMGDEHDTRIRNEALEEAAKVVDDHYWDTCSPGHGEFLAKTIRALKEKPHAKV